MIPGDENQNEGIVLCELVFRRTVIFSGDLSVQEGKLMVDFIFTCEFNVRVLRINMVEEIVNVFFRLR